MVIICVVEIQRWSERGMPKEGGGEYIGFIATLIGLCGPRGVCESSRFWRACDETMGVCHCSIQKEIIG